MYVIMDMEWIDDRAGVHCPTQVAALRVDGQWDPVDRFGSLVCPGDERCRDWRHVAFTGATPDRFLSAPRASDAFSALLRWLREEDVLLWWSDEPALAFIDAAVRALGRKPAQPLRLLRRAVNRACGERGSAYAVGRALGAPVAGVPHVSTDDVEAIRALLKRLGLDPSAITEAPVRKAAPARTPLVYFYDPVGGRVHVAQSGCLPAGTVLQGFTSVRGCVKRGLRPCPVCCAKAYRRDSMALTAEVISRAEYNFVYRPRSEVFHTAECVHARRIPYWDVKGSATYAACACLGLRPCRLCRPTPGYLRPLPPAKPAPPALPGLTVVKPAVPQPAPASPKAQAPLPGMTRALNIPEKRAYDRFVRAARAREADREAARDADFMTRTSAACAFWAGRGYRSFHLADCPKLAGLTDLTGFSRYSQALRKGLTPCRLCRPSPRNDLVISVPGGSCLRDDESPRTLDALCEARGYAHELRGSLYFIGTPVGRWRFDIQKLPVKLWHINLVNHRGRPDSYHRQPTLPLSLRDTFNYIHRHDRQLMKQVGMTPPAAPPPGPGEDIAEDLDELLLQVDHQLQALEI